MAITITRVPIAYNAWIRRDEHIVAYSFDNPYKSVVFTIENRFTGEITKLVAKNSNHAHQLLAEYNGKEDSLRCMGCGDAATWFTTMLQTGKIPRTQREADLLCAWI